MKEVHYKKLVERYKSKKATDEELIVFFHLLKEGQLDEYLGDSFVDAADAMTISNDQPQLPDEYRIPRKRLWPRVAIAAAIIGLVSMVTLFVSDKSGSSPDRAGKTTAKQPVIAYNNISTPPGQQREFTLPDGTRVWLNAASSLRFPPAFDGSERVVELDGESYFEVAKNASKPFKVKMRNGVEITVLGTQFNVHAYSDEPISATLLEGSIKLQSQQGSAVLKPGQEALVEGLGNVKITDADLESAMAWKNGLFQFNRADITTVMKQIEKWYGVEVVYEGKIPEKEFVGKVPRNSDINEVLQILRLSKINFRIEGKKIIVLP